MRHCVPGLARIVLLNAALLLWEPARLSAGSVAAWGSNTSGQINVPAGLGDVLAIAAGENYSVALQGSGRVVVWGDSAFNQTNVPSGLDSVVAIAAGWHHVLALRADGTVAAWGAGMVDDHQTSHFGQSIVPSEVTNVVAIAAGEYHSMALRADGTVLAWGDNSLLQAQVPDGLSNVVAIAAGRSHNLALKHNGTAVGWGDNRQHQIDVPGGLSGVVRIAAGGSHSLAVKADGRMIAWGSQTNVPASLAIPDAMIISTSPGSGDAATNKSVARTGNVVVNASVGSQLLVDGGGGWSVFANGRVNGLPTGDTVSMTNWNTANELPEYTAQDTQDTLFDLQRLIAVADLSGTHYTNLTQFFVSNNVASIRSNGALEGVIVVDIRKSDRWFNDLDPIRLPYGINVRGTLLFNFSNEFDPNDKIVSTAALNINAADLSGFLAANPATYTSGYPPAYEDPARNPINVDITSKGFANLTASDELPALITSMAIFDIHGAADVCGVVYSPSFIEIENRNSMQLQYFRGSLIGGAGVYLETTNGSTSVFSHEARRPIAIATRASQNLALRINGAVISWGDTMDVPAGLTNVAAIASGVSHHLALIGETPPQFTPRLIRASVSTEGFRVSLQTQAGRVYRLEYKGSLDQHDWIGLLLVAGTGSVLELTDRATGLTQRFYRASVW